MIIEINDSNTMEEISGSFTHFFPFLKLEFYDEPHIWQGETSRKHLLPADKTIGEIRKKHNPGMLEIRKDDSTGTVEQKFRKHFGLNVQVFRLHGDVWVQTAGTDLLTIEEQNEIGRNASLGLLHSPEPGFKREKLL